jgi:predicted nucleotidyltransferase
MNIETLLSTRERIKILRGIIYRKEILGVNSVAKELALSNGLVSIYFGMLARAGVLRRKDGKFLLRDSIATKALKVFLNLDMFDRDLFQKHKFIRSAGIYGSFIKGTNTEDSDIDIWILIAKASDHELAELTGELKNTFGNIKPLYLTENKIKALKKTDPVFYYSILFGSVVLYGDGIEAI